MNIQLMNSQDQLIRQVQDSNAREANLSARLAKELAQAKSPQCELFTYHILYAQRAFYLVPQTRNMLLTTFLTKNTSLFIMVENAANSSQFYWRAIQLSISHSSTNGQGLTIMYAGLNGVFYVQEDGFYNFEIMNLTQDHVYASIVIVSMPTVGCWLSANGSL